MQASGDHHRAAPSIGSSAWYPLRQLHRELVAVRDRFAFGRAGMTILDFGAGEVPYRHLFARDAIYLAADIGDDAEIAVFEDGTVDLADNTVDLVTSFQVLEHVSDVTVYLKEAVRVLRPGGYLLLTTHGVWPFHPHPTDYWRWTQDGLTRVVTAAGFQIEHQRGLVGPLGWTDQIRMAALRRLLMETPGLRIAAPLLAVLYNAKIAVLDGLTPDRHRQRDPSIIVVVARVGSSVQGA
ncbi:MAG: class I SAM-dependent methyltransferase [Acidimicrobiia bacterium]